MLRLIAPIVFLCATLVAGCGPVPTTEADFLALSNKNRKVQIFKGEPPRGYVALGPLQVKLQRGHPQCCYRHVMDAMHALQRDAEALGADAVINAKFEDYTPSGFSLEGWGHVAGSGIAVKYR